MQEVANCERVDAMLMQAAEKPMFYYASDGLVLDSTAAAFITSTLAGKHHTLLASLICFCV